MCQWKNFENQSVAGKDMDKSLVVCCCAWCVLLSAIYGWWWVCTAGAGKSPTTPGAERVEMSAQSVGWRPSPRLHRTVLSSVLRLPRHAPRCWVNVYQSRCTKEKVMYGFLWETRCRATEHHLPYGITHPTEANALHVSHIDRLD